MTYNPDARAMFDAAWGPGGHQPTPDQILAGYYPDHASAADHFAEDPEPLGGSETEPVPINLRQTLPDALASFTQVVSDHLEIPAEATAFMAIAALSSAAVGRYRIHGGGGWTQPLIMWMACGLLPGERKSDLVRITSAPLRIAEMAGIAAHKDLMKQADRDRDIVEADIASIKEQLRKKSRNSAQLEADLEVAQKQLDGIPEENEAPPRILVDNITPEMLSVVLAKNNEALGSMSAEGDVFAVIAGRYSNGKPNFELHLKSFDEDPSAVDRVGRPTVLLHHPALAMGMCVQPTVINKVSEIPEAREKGFLGRWYWTVPKSRLGHRQNLRLMLDPAWVQWWSQMLNHILAVTPRKDPVPMLLLSPGADRLLQELLDHIEPHLEDQIGRFAHMSDWASKLSGKTLRLAGLFHLVQGLDQHTAVSEETMQQAVSFGLWAVREAERVYQAWQREEMGPGVSAILTWVRRRKPEVFTAGDVKNSLRKSGWYTTDARDAALVALHQARWIASVTQVDSQGRARPTCEFVPHPALLGRP